MTDLNEQIDGFIQTAMAIKSQRDHLQDRVEKLESECSRLREISTCHSVGGWTALEVQLMKERDKLYQQLKQARSYMDHDVHCSDRQPAGICCCGFKDFLADLSAVQP